VADTVEPSHQVASVWPRTPLVIRQAVVACPAVQSLALSCVVQVIRADLSLSADTLRTVARLEPS
jgi:hypothetical protein